VVFHHKPQKDIMSNQPPTRKSNLPANQDNNPAGTQDVVNAINGLSLEMSKMNHSLNRLDTIDRRLAELEKEVRTLTEDMSEIHPKEMAANMNRINTAIFGNEDLKVPSLRDDIKGIRDEVTIMMTTYDRVKWAATLLGISNVTQLIYWARIILGLGGGTP